MKIRFEISGRNDGSIGVFRKIGGEVNIELTEEDVNFQVIRALRDQFGFETDTLKILSMEES